ncbi:MAG: hypothetical protein ACP5VQ_08060, partial [Phycisphaerae bacterium]
MNKPFLQIHRGKFRGGYFQRSLCAMAALGALVGLSGCGSIDSGGFEDYQSSAIAHQQAIESGAATQTSVKELSSALPPGTPRPVGVAAAKFASS